MQKWVESIGYRCYTSCVLFLLVFGAVAQTVAGERQYPRLPLSPAALTLVEQAFHGIQEGENIDYHLHIVGDGDGVDIFESRLPAQEQGGCQAKDFIGTPVYINPQRFSFWRGPILHVKTKAFMYASGMTAGLWGSLDRQQANNRYVDHLLSLVSHYRPGSVKPGRFVLLAMDGYYAKGQIDWAQTDFQVPNEYALRLTDCMNRVFQYEQQTDFSPFLPAISLHPGRPDAIAQLTRLSQQARYVKWLPNTMNIDPSSGEAVAFAAQMKRLGMTLITHTGYEDASEALEENQRYGNPTLYQDILETGVEVIMAHSGYKGQNVDFTEPEPLQSRRENTVLFNAMLAQYPNNLRGGLSALVFIEKQRCLAGIGLNCSDEKRPLAMQLKRFLNNEAQRFEGRLVYGSDFPLPGIAFLNPTDTLKDQGFLSASQASRLEEIWSVNPLLYDFVLKRTLHHPEEEQKQLPLSSFGPPAPSQAFRE